MSQISFSWSSHQGYGLLLSIVGYSIILQTVPIYHLGIILKLNIDSLWLPLLGVFIFTVCTLSALMSSILENWEKDLYKNGIFKLHLILIPIIFLFLLGYLWTVPFLNFIAPFANVTALGTITGLYAYIADTSGALICVGILWSISEAIPAK